MESVKSRNDGRLFYKVYIFMSPRPTASLVQREVARRSRDGGIVGTNYGIISSRLRRGGAFCKGIVSTPTRRGPTFVCARRRGLCSISDCYPYGIDNPPTLRRSSFPQRASRPAGGPIPKHTWGCAPRPPNAQAAAGYERCKHRPYGAADTLSRCLRRILFWILLRPN